MTYDISKIVTAVVQALPGGSSDNPANPVHPKRDGEQLQEEVENASTTTAADRSTAIYSDPSVAGRSNANLSNPHKHADTNRTGPQDFGK